MQIHYKLRITLTHCNPVKVLSLIDTISTEYAYVEENGEKQEQPHFHLYLISSSKEDTIRTKLRSLTKSARGNKLYSLVKLSIDDEESIAIEYLAYMMKKNPVSYVGVWVEDEIEKAKAYDESVKEEMKEKKEKRKSRFIRLDEAFTSDECYKSKTYDSNYIIEFVIEFMSNEQSTVSVSTIESHCNTLLMRYDKGYKQKLSCVISKRLFQQF